MILSPGAFDGREVADAGARDAGARRGGLAGLAAERRFPSRRPFAPSLSRNEPQGPSPQETGSTSRRTRPPSLTEMGRPAGVVAVYPGSSPTAVAMVAMRSGTPVAGPRGFAPSSSVAPMTTLCASPAPENCGPAGRSRLSLPLMARSARPNFLGVGDQRDAGEVLGARPSSSDARQGRRAGPALHSVVVVLRNPSRRGRPRRSAPCVDEGGARRGISNAGVAVGLAHGLRLVPDGERVELRRLHQTDGLRVHRSAARDLRVTRGLLEGLVHGIERRVPALELAGVHTGAGVTSSVRCAEAAAGRRDRSRRRGTRPRSSVPRC